MDVEAAVKSTARGEQDCALLNRMPAEIRNHIYELVCAPAPCNDLLAASLPSKTILLTCRQVYAEAREIFRQGYRAFRSDPHLTQRLPQMRENRALRQQFKAFMDSISDGDTKYIASLTIGKADKTTRYLGDGSGGLTGPISCSYSGKTRRGYQERWQERRVEVVV